MATNLTPTVVNLSNNQDIDALLWGWKWGSSNTGTDLSYSFPATVAANTVGEYTNYVEIDNFSAFNAAQQTAVKTAYALISSFCNLTFTETTNTGATFRFGNADKINYTNDTTVATLTGLHPPGLAPGTAEGAPPQLAFGSTPPTVPTYAQGDAWFVTNGYTTPVLGSFQETAGIFHEIGHTLGLKHGHVTQGGHGVTFPALPADHNSYEYSIMTYSQFPGDNPANGDNAPDHPTTYMQDDIAALQYLYGAHYAAGAHTYTWDPTTGQESIDGVGQGAPQSNFVLMTVWDGGGNATYDFSNYNTNLSVNLNPGQWTILDTSAAHAQRADLGNNGATPTPGPEYFARGNIANALIDPNNPNETTSLIRNAVGGSGNDTIVGNAADNVITGGPGNDTIDGGGGTNTAVYSGARSDYTATLENNGSIQIADNRAGSPDGTDTDTNIQLFKFSDRTYNTIELLNHAPVLSSDTSSPHNDTEIFPGSNLDTPHPFSGTLSFTDVDAGDTHTASQSLQSETWSGGAPSSIPQPTLTALAAAMSDSISLDSTSTTAGTLSWSFSLADKYLDFLAAGETLTAVYDVTVADHHTGSTVSATSTVPVTIVFTGTNDNPVFVAAPSTLTGTVNEQPNVTGSSTPDTTPAGNKIAFSDPDLNDRPTGTIDSAHQTVTWQDATHDYTSQLTAAQIASLEGAFSIQAEAANSNNGAIDWTYSIVDSNLDFLGVGETLTITTPVVIDDHNGGTFTENVVVTAIGANDPPISTPDSNGTPKDSTLTVSAAKGVLANDTDPDTHDQGHLVVGSVDGSVADVGQAIAGTYGSLTLNADGSYVYVANQGALPSQFVAQDIFTYTVADPHGGTDTSTLSIVVFNPGVSYQAGSNTTLIGGNGQNVLDGSAGHDILLGGNASDVLIGGNGDTLTGNNGPDTFLFRPNFGANTITDLNINNDAIQLDKSIFTSVTDMLKNHTVDTAAGAVITDTHGDTITLVGVTVAQLQADASIIHLV